MNWNGIIIGIASFLCIGIFHPIVIKTEYYFSKKVWPVFLTAGLILCGLSVFVENVVISAVIAVAAFSCWWSILELYEQEERVRKGWFPANPKRMKGLVEEKFQFSMIKV